jgi:hypothetical protein
MMHARWRGRLDGRNAVTVPADPAKAWTPFIDGACHSAGKVSNQTQVRLLTTRKELVTAIYREAGSVVRQHDGMGILTEGTRGRLIVSLTEWRAEAASAKVLAEAAVNSANQLIACYWQAYLLGYASGGDNGGRPLPRVWRPVDAELDPIWDKIDALLMLSYGTKEDEATRKAGHILSRALDIIAYCECAICRKLPEAISHDQD